MTFNEIVADVADRMNISSPTSIDRIGLHVNRRYRRLRTSLGMTDVARTTKPYAMVTGSASQVIHGLERVISVSDLAQTPVRLIDQVTFEEMLAVVSRTDRALQWAVEAVSARQVTLKFDTTFAAATSMQIEGEPVATTLSDDLEPSFPESFHDILVFGAIADELRKMEKVVLARDAETDYERVLSELRLKMATTSWKDIVQGKYNITLSAHEHPNSAARWMV